MINIIRLSLAYIKLKICMLRSLLFRNPTPLDLKKDEEMLFPDTQKQVPPLSHAYVCQRISHPRQTFVFILLPNPSLEQQIDAFLEIDVRKQQLCELRYDFQKLRGYEQDKIKFMAKVEVNETKCEGMRSCIKIAKEPIFAKNDVITFLLIFEWFPNSTRPSNKLRKGSFATQKEFTSLKVRYSKHTIEQQELLHIVFLLSQKIYIEDRFIDDFVKSVAKGGETHYKQLNCLTILLLGSDSKQRIGNLASTMADTNKYQLYQFENISMYNSLAEPDKIVNANQDYLLNRFTTLLHSSSSSRLFDRSARLSAASRDNLEDSFSKSEARFNVDRAKKYFSAVEYLTATSEVSIQMIIYHLGEDRNSIEGGLKAEVIQEVITQWPRHNSYARIYKLNKERIMEDLLDRAVQNYRLLVSMELEEIEVVKLDQIYIKIQELSDKIIEEFMAAGKEYMNESDYDSYVLRLEKEMGLLQNELISNYAMTKYEYGSRVIKNLEKKSYKSSLQNYLLMKILGKDELNDLDIGYRMYKQLMQSKLQQGFKEFQANKYKSRSYDRKSGNSYEDELNHVENRIQICQAKKKNLDSAIQLGQKETESLQLMLKLLGDTQRADSAKSQLLIE